MNSTYAKLAKYWRLLPLLLLLMVARPADSQTFKYKTSSASGICIAHQLYAHGFPDTIITWSNEWDDIMSAPTTWQNHFKFKSNQSFVKFFIDHYFPKTQLPYTYQLVYQIYGYASVADTTTYVLNNDTLTITNFDHSDPKNAFQDIQLAKYSNYYKTMVVLQGIYVVGGGTPTAANLSDSLRWNFNIESSILTQRYDKDNYGAGTSLETSQTPDPANNILNVYFNLPGGTTPVQLTPVSYELEWTYIDDYQRDLSSGDVTEQSLSALQYNFTNNSTRVWLDSSHYRIPIVYPNGYIAYRVRMVRPDSVLFKYPIYSDWSYNIANSGSLYSLNSSYPSAVYHISDAYTHDSLNWQYTISFAEGGKYKHVLSFYDGLLKNRESITRFNSNLNKLIVTKNVYDFEGRPSIKTLPAPVSTSAFSFQQNVDVNSVTGLPYSAADFDTGWHICPGDPVLSPLASSALANIYYSSSNPDISGCQRYVPDAGGYPLIQTIYSPAFNDRIEKQGGAGPRLQIPDSNIISNYYVTTGQMVLNRLFGVNAGWNNYYNMTVSRDPNMQLSMSIKNYEGKQVASSLIGVGGNPVDHAIDPVDVPSPIYYQEDILKSLPQSIVDNRRIADKDFFNEVEGNDSVRYSYQFDPYPVCPSQYLSVQAHYSYEVTDQCGDTVFAQDSTLGVTGVVSSPSTFSGSGTLMHLGVGQYSVHKELLIREDDVEAALDSFFAAPPNCLRSEPWFIRQSVESKHFPCPFQDDDPCSIKKAQMIKDLTPGGTYAGFTIGPDGHAVGTPPSIIEWHDKPCGDCPGGSSGGYAHYTYQDSCIIMRIPDTITISGIQYYHLRSMSVDSFIMVYNLAIAAGNTSIAEALLPLHPEYCALKACITDTFKTLLLSIPNAHVAENLHLLYLDSIIAHDPLVGILSGYASTADSLATFPGGHYRLDYPEFLKLYCGCSDSVMLKECALHIFNNEINNRVLVNDALKQQYFSDMVNVYLQNRQRFVDAFIATGAGDSCMVCDSARLPMSTTTGGLFPHMTTSTGAPGSSFFSGAWDTISTTGTWLLGAMGSIGAPMDSVTTAIYLDSATTIYTAADSTMCHGAIDSIVGHLFNCGNGIPTVISGIHSTLDSLCSAHIIHNGNFTPDIIRFVIQRNGAPLDDFCNPYLVGTGVHPAAAAGQYGCKSDSFYVNTTRYLNKPAVLNSLIHPGTSYHDTLRYLTNSFEQFIYNDIGEEAPVITTSDYDVANTLYTIHVYNDPSLGSGTPDTVKIYLRSTGTCAGVFAAGATGDSLTFADVICPNEASPGFISGFINEFSFIAHVRDYHDTTVHTCTMLGWTDSVETMADRDNNIADCIPCTEMRKLYQEFADTLASYGIVGSDHPLYESMLLHFMNYKLPNSFESDQYDKFITSCALADSMFMRLYVGYVNLKFANDGDANTFMTFLNGIDPDISFDENVYRESSSTGITISVDLNIVPAWELHTYRVAISGYTGSFGSRIVNQGLSTFQGDTVVGLVYAYPGSVMPAAAAVFGAGTTLHFTPVETRSIWMGTGYVNQDFYYLIDQPSVTRPYEVSAGVYELQRYFINNSIGATLVSNYQSTVNKDYFKPHKKDYLTYTYQYQPLPSYKVLDSIQAQYLVARIPSYSESDATYQHPFNPSIITNLYLSDTSMVNNYFDTLRYILQTVASDNIVNPGFTFFDTNKVVVHTTIDSPLIAYRCSDGTYWYRYFGNGDTLYNVYVAMPKWIPTWQHKYYRIISIGPPVGITPALGDSLSRFFTLNLRRDGDTAVIQAKGMTTFVIAKNEVLKDVLLGNPLTEISSPPPTDTFNNCERQLLNTGIREGVVAYQVYLDSVRSAIRDGFIAFMLDHVKEQLIIGYQTNEFNYTLYYYDRAGNLSATVPPAGLNPLPMTSLDAVDGERTAGTASSSVVASHNKVSSYNYNSVNQVVVQTTPDAGETKFFYDAANRLICSQNAKQAPTGYCTYNLYDHQNRIIETGEAKLLCPFFSEFTITAGSPLPDCYFTYPGIYGTVASPYSPVIKNLKIWPQDSVIKYIRSQNRRDVVATVYDTANTNLHAITGLDAQENLRKRVSCAKFFEYLSASDIYQSFYTYATHYSYDIEGNVKCLVQDFPALDHLGERYKRVDYDYDLISGKVNLLSYNRSFSDQYYQRYSYDDDNRITKVETSGDGIIWHRDAEYSYYQHGPLARIDAGDLRIQGIDFAYTIQGWLKLMNADSLDSHMDMGGDADVTINAKDAVAYAIDYFKNDYKPITSWPDSHVVDESRSLYNGNISRQTMAIADFRRLNKQYVYDQLNRIKSANYATVVPADGALTPTGDFKNSYTYDADGNINTLKRYGNNTGTGALIMDSLFYTYGTGVGGYSLNQLKSLTDMAADSYTNDIKYNGGSTAATHYAYDPIGNTTRDLISGQDTIKWNLYNKVVETRNSSANNFMDFKYDAAGNRVAKYFTTMASTGNTEDNNYYVRDAQGNILAIYHEKVQYKVSSIDWIRGWHLDFLGAGGTPTGYVHFVATDFGNLSSFTGAVLPHALSNYSFLHSIIDRPVSYYMSHDNSIYTDLTQGMIEWVPKITDMDRQNNTTVVRDAMVNAAWNDPQNLYGVMMALTNDPNLFMQAMNVMCNVGGLDAFVDAFTDPSGNNGGMACSDAINVFQARGEPQLMSQDPKEAANVVNNMISAANLYPDQFAMFLSGLAYDQITLDMVNNNPQSPYYPALQPVVSNFGDRSAIYLYFDNDGDEAQQQLDRAADDSRKLNICYNDCQECFLSAFDSVLADNYMDSAIALTSGLLPPEPYASRLSYLTGVYIYPFPRTTTSVSYNSYGLAEHDFYGSSRLGVKNYWPGQVGLLWDYDHSIYDTIAYKQRRPWYSMEYQDVIKDTARDLYGNTHIAKYLTQHLTGQKQYEVTDHLGDVLATLSDARMPVPPTSDTTTGYMIASYAPVVKTAYDYYPFGMYMPGRYTEDTQMHCTSTTALVMVPTTTSTWVPWVFTEVTYVGSPTVSPIDQSGGIVLNTHIRGDGISFTNLIAGTGLPIPIQLSYEQANVDFIAYVIEDGKKVLNSQILHAGTRGTVSLDYTSTGSAVSVLVSSLDDGDDLIWVHGHWVTTTTYTPRYVTTNVCSDDQYRYGYNTQMKVNEWAGKGNHYTAKWWDYDSRIARRFNIEPKFKKFPGVSPYATNKDNPVMSNDPNGDTPVEGAVLGGLAFAFSLGKSWLHDGNKAFDKQHIAKTLGKATNAGVQGFMVGLTDGASLLVSATMQGGMSTVGSLIDDGIDGQHLQWGKAVFKGVTSFATVGLFGGVGFDGAVKDAGLKVLVPATGAYNAVDYGIDAVWESRRHYTLVPLDGLNQEYWNNPANW